MRALVTGADGLLGSNLVRELIAADFSVRVFIHPASKSKTLDGLPIERLTGDILNRDNLIDAAKGCDAVFHVAASTAMWPARDPKIFAVNVDGTRNVIDACVANGAKRLVHVGSASSFGYGSKENPGTEETPFKYKSMRLAYFDSKLQAQELVLKSVSDGKLDAVVVNPTFMFGAYDSGPSSGKMIVKVIALKPPFYPPGGRCFVHVRDVAQGLISAFEKGRSGECYIAGNKNMDMGELFTAICELVGARPPKLQIPEPAVLLAGRIGSAVADVSGKAPELSLEMAKSGCVGSYYSSAKAIRELGLPQTPVETALEDSYRWLSDNGYIKGKQTLLKFLEK